MTKKNQKSRIFACTVKGCDKVYKTAQGVVEHLRVKHNISAPYRPHYTIDGVAGNKNGKRKYVRKAKSTPRVIGPISNYIDMQVTLRIPITVGQIQILAGE